VDVNKDGRPDLVMGSPHYSLGNMTQNGMVAVLISKEMGLFPLVFYVVPVTYIRNNSEFYLY
jgi:hypothetical protein